MRFRSVRVNNFDLTLGLSEATGNTSLCSRVQHTSSLRRAQSSQPVDHEAFSTLFGHSVKHHFFSKSNKLPLTHGSEKSAD